MRLLLFRLRYTQHAENAVSGHGAKQLYVRGQGVNQGKILWGWVSTHNQLAERTAQLAPSALSGSGSGPRPRLLGPSRQHHPLGAIGPSSPAVSSLPWPRLPTFGLM